MILLGLSPGSNITILGEGELPVPPHSRPLVPAQEEPDQIPLDQTLSQSEDGGVDYRLHYEQDIDGEVNPEHSVWMNVRV